MEINITNERANLAFKLADVLEDNKEELAQLMTDEMGKVKAQGFQEVELCAAICRFTAEQAPKVLADEEREFEQGATLFTYKPIGVVLGIQPWDFPYTK